MDVEPPAHGDDDGGEHGRTVACRPHMRGGAAARAALEAHVQKIHRVMLLATEAIALLIHEDVEAGVAPADMLRVGDHGLLNSMLNGVVDGHGPDADKHPENARAHRRVRDAYRRIHGAQAPLVPGAGLAQSIAIEAQSYRSLVKTSLRVHFRQRVKRYCKLRLAIPDADFARLTKAERTAHALRVVSVATDVCRPAWVDPVVADATDAAFVAQTRAMLGMDAIDWSPANRAGKRTNKTLTDVIKAKPHLFFAGMAALNRAFAAEGKATFRIVPIRTSLTPRFTTLDQKVLKEAGLVDSEAKARLAKRAKERCEKTAPYRTRLTELATELRNAKSEWKQADLARNANVPTGKKRIPPDDEERERRNAFSADHARRVAVVRDDPTYVALCDAAAAEKRETFEAVFDLRRGETPNGAPLAKKAAARWVHSMKTDGVSARVLLSEKPVGGTKRGRDGRVPIPRRGLHTVERLRESLFGSEKAPALHPEWVATLDGMGAREQNEVLNEMLGQTCVGGEVPDVVGGDPGMWELLRLANPDLSWATTRKARDAHRGEGAERLSNTEWARELDAQSAGYTLKQRREENAPARYFLKQRHRDDPERRRRYDTARAYRHAHLSAPDAVDQAEKALSAHNSNGPTAAKLLQYLRARSAALPTLAPWYTHRQRRLLRWKRFINEQRSFSHFCDRIRKMVRQREDGSNRPLVIAYGAKGMSNGLVVGGIPPCINTGLRKKLSREFLTVPVPEHYTSKRCFHCGGECGNHAHLAERDRRIQSDERLEARLSERLARADTPAERRRAREWFERVLDRPCEIRGLRFCAGCSRCLNRDANSAPQMAVQLKRLLLGLGPLYTRTRAEERLDALDGALEQP
jgi:hypothetical protein